MGTLDNADQHTRTADKKNFTGPEKSEQRGDEYRLAFAISLINLEAPLLDEKYNELYVGREVHGTSEDSDKVKKAPDYIEKLEALKKEVETFQGRVDEILGKELLEAMNNHPSPDDVVEWQPYFNAAWKLPFVSRIQKEIDMTKYA